MGKSSPEQQTQGDTVCGHVNDKNVGCCSNDKSEKNTDKLIFNLFQFSKVWGSGSIMTSSLRLELQSMLADRINTTKIFLPALKRTYQKNKQQQKPLSQGQGEKPAVTV